MCFKFDRPYRGDIWDDKWRWCRGRGHNGSRKKKERKLYNSDTKLRNLYECENTEWFISLVFIIFIGSIQPFEFKKKKKRDTMR